MGCDSYFCRPCGHDVSLDHQPHPGAVSLGSRATPYSPSTVCIEKHVPDALGEVEHNLLIHDTAIMFKGRRIGGPNWRNRTSGHHVWKALKHLFWYAVGNGDEPHLTHAATRLLFALQLVFEQSNHNRAHYGVGRHNG